jgi:hypothetical protein
MWDILQRDQLWQDLPEQVRLDLEKEENQQTKQDVWSGVGWLRDALNTARSAAGPDTTRKQQRLAAEHLGTLFREAEREPQRAGRYKTLVENVLNPIVSQAPQSGIFGHQRALASVPGSSFVRRGFGIRNPAFT